MGHDKRWPGQLAGILCGLATPAQAEVAYGIEMAADPALHGCINDDQPPGIVICHNVRFPDSRRAAYAIKAFPDTGICWLMSASRPEDLMGQSIRATTDVIVAELAGGRNNSANRYHDTRRILCRCVSDYLSPQAR